MKYGIQVKYKTGDVQYVSSTRHRCPTLTDDITEIALFVQEKSAIDAVKVIRKNGYEPEGAELKVVGVVMKIETMTKVPYPVAKTGFVIEDQEPLGYHNNEMYYTGTKKPSSSHTQYQLFGNIERATVFVKEEHAKKRIAELLAEAKKNVIDERNRDLPVYYCDGPIGKARAEERKASCIKRAEELVARLERVEITCLAHVEM